MFQNPVTSEKFENLDDYVQSLIESYAVVKQELFVYAEREGKIVRALDEIANKHLGSECRRGIVTLDGITKTVKITRKTNAKYEKARGAEHPLRKLVQDFESLASKIRVDYKESGKAIQDLMDRHAKEEYLLDDDIALAEELARVRTESAAKSSIEIKDRTDAPKSTTSTETKTPTF